MDVLDKIIEDIKKHKVKTILIVLAFFLIPLLIIHSVYSFSIPFLESHWSAGDLLGYYASFVSTLGTIALSLVAVRLSYSIAKSEKARLDKIRNAEIIAAKAELVVTLIRFIYGFTSNTAKGKQKYIAISVNNKESNKATDIQILNPLLTLQEDVPIELTLDNDNVNFVDANDNIVMILLNAREIEVGTKLTFTLSYKDKYYIHKAICEAHYSNIVHNQFGIDMFSEQEAVLIA